MITEEVDIIIAPVRWDDTLQPRVNPPSATEWEKWLPTFRVRVAEWHSNLTKEGQLFVLVDSWMMHHVRLELEQSFGEGTVLNEIIWVERAGKAQSDRWNQQYQAVFWVVKTPKKFTFNFDDMERIPYMAPGLVSKEKAARGKTPTDVWWHSRIPQEEFPEHTPPPLFWQRLLRVHTGKNARVRALDECTRAVELAMESEPLSGRFALI